MNPASSHTTASGLDGVVVAGGRPERVDERHRDAMDLEGVYSHAGAVPPARDVVLLAQVRREATE